MIGHNVKSTHGIINSIEGCKHWPVGLVGRQRAECFRCFKEFGDIIQTTYIGIVYYTVRVVEMKAIFKMVGICQQYQRYNGYDRIFKCIILVHATKLQFFSHKVAAPYIAIIYTARYFKSTIIM